MGYRILAEAAMISHFLFLVYVVTGGFLAWRWPKAIWPHVAMAGWGFSTVIFGLDCPLTYVEDWGRRKAGQEGLETGFIDHYLEGVVYPDRYAGLMQLLAGIAVVVSWTGVVVIQIRRRRQAGRAQAP